METQNQIATQKQILTPDNFEELKANAETVFNLLDVSQQTIKDYKYRLPRFLDFIEKNGFNRMSYLEFKRYLETRNDFSISSKNHFLITARIWLRELYKLGKIPVDITLNISTFSESKKHKKQGLDDEEIERLTNWLKELPPTAQIARLRAMFSLFIFEGLRTVEVARLDFEDLDLANNRTLILSKGAKDKEWIKLLPKTVKHLKEHLNQNNIKAGAIFLCQSNSNKNKRLTTRSIRREIKGVFEKLGISKDVHSLRHYYITKLIKAYDGNLLQVAKYTRHNSLDMLMVYNDEISIEQDFPRLCSVFRGINF